eukprot:m.83163 g.83163  ORF g.83163 m.83163 type:complete len:302 (+) comp8153_c0_seq1:1873-2778(+)
MCVCVWLCRLGRFDHGVPILHQHVLPSRIQHRRHLRLHRRRSDIHRPGRMLFRAVQAVGRGWRRAGRPIWRRGRVCDGDSGGDPGPIVHRPRRLRRCRRLRGPVLILHVLGRLWRWRERAGGQLRRWWQLCFHLIGHLCQHHRGRRWRRRWRRWRQRRERGCRRPDRAERTDTGLGLPGRLWRVDVRWGCNRTMPQRQQPVLGQHRLGHAGRVDQQRRLWWRRRRWVLRRWKRDSARGLAARRRWWRVGYHPGSDGFDCQRERQRHDSGIQRCGPWRQGGRRDGGHRWQRSHRCPLRLDSV